MVANTANIGSSQAQLKQSQARAMHVGRYLQRFEQLNQTIGVLGVGSQKPVASEYTTAGRDDNKQRDHQLRQP